MVICLNFKIQIRNNGFFFGSNKNIQMEKEKKGFFGFSSCLILKWL